MKHYISNGDFRFVVNIDNSILEEGLDEMEINYVDLGDASVQCATVTAYHHWMDNNSPDGPKKMGELTFIDERGYRDEETADEKTKVFPTEFILEQIAELDEEMEQPMAAIYLIGVCVLFGITVAKQEQNSEVRPYGRALFFAKISAQKLCHKNIKVRH